jgi:hypothetical protein
MDAVSLGVIRAISNKKWLGHPGDPERGVPPVPDGQPPYVNWTADPAKRRRVHFDEGLELLESQLENLLRAVEFPWLRMEADEGKLIEFKAPASTKPPDSRPVPEEQLVKGVPAPLPREDMYGVVGDIVEVLTPWTEAPPVALYASLLSYAGSRIAPGAWTTITQTKHTTRLWFALVGGTGTARKGTSKDVVSYVMELALPTEDPRSYVYSGLSSGEGLAEIFKSLEDRRLLVFESEFARFLVAQQREGNILGFVVRDLWDHPYFQNFSKSSKINIPDAHLTFLGHMTIEEFQSRSTEVDFFSGSYNRFIFMFAQRERLIADPREIHDPRLSKLAGQLGEAIEKGRSLGAVKWTKPAKRLWEEYYYGHLHPIGPLGALTARWDAQNVRLALTLAVLDGGMIRAEHIEHAYKLWEYAEMTVRAIVGVTTGNKNADKILEALNTKGDLSRTDILRNVLGGNVTSDELQVLGKILKDYGVTRTVRKTKGRPAEIWSME